MEIDVRFSNGSPQAARVFFELGNTEVTVRYSISNSVASLEDIDVPLKQAGNTLDLNEFTLIQNGIQDANTAVGDLSFIQSVE